jgi:hypothetical protein
MELLLEFFVDAESVLLPKQYQDLTSLYKKEIHTKVQLGF